MATEGVESSGKRGAAVLLRNVELGDVDAYVRMRCDPVMMTELGGPLPREGIEDKVARDVRATAVKRPLERYLPLPGLPVRW